MIDRDRLRSEMERQGVSQAALARAAEVSPASIQQILNGAVRSPRSIRKIADILGVSVDWLEGVADDPKRVFLEDVQDDDLTPKAFQYFSQQGSGDAKAVSNKIVLFSKSWIERIAGTSQYESVVVFRINSSDMAPTLSPHDEVILASREFDGHPDSIWFFRFGGETFIRRVRRSEPGRLVITSDNPAYATFEAEEKDVEFLGCLVWHGRKIGP